MSPALLLRAALLALCACAAHSAVVSSTYSLIDTSVSNFPFLPSVRLSVALYTTTFDAPAYFVPGGCKQGPLCNQTNFGTCCSACDGITPLVSPLNRPGCVCPSFPNSYCIDATAPFPAPDWFYRCAHHIARSLLTRWADSRSRRRSSSSKSRCCARATTS